MRINKNHHRSQIMQCVDYVTNLQTSGIWCCHLSLKCKTWKLANKLSNCPQPLVLSSPSIMTDSRVFHPKSLQYQAQQQRLESESSTSQLIARATERLYFNSNTKGRVTFELSTLTFCFCTCQCLTSQPPYFINTNLSHEIYVSHWKVTDSICNVGQITFYNCFLICKIGIIILS